jgi:hypothetical protein
VGTRILKNLPLKALKGDIPFLLQTIAGASSFGF